MGGAVSVPCPTVKQVSVVQLFASVTVTQYCPAAKFEILDPEELLFHEYEYGAVPPLAVTDKLPSVPPGQEGAAELFKATEREQGGC